MTGGGSGGGLGLTLQQLGCTTTSGTDQQQSLLFPCRRRMTMMVRPNHDRAFEGGGGGGGGDSGPGPTTGAGGAEEAVRCLSDNNICDVGGGGGTVVVKTSLTNYTTPLQQPFHISSATAAAAAAAATPSHTFKSPGAGAGAGGMMAASLGFPFTAAQWKELERQAMIYKYMVASVPVPPELLFPITRNFPHSSSSAVSASSPHSTLGRGSIFNLRFANGSDPEPGRCRRTDGKKWRCSRDVAPNQKYCERHMHRGRPRSRKPVEPHTDPNTNYSHKKTRHSHPPLPLPATHSNPIMIPNPHPPSQSQYLGSALDPFHQTSPVFLYKYDTKASPFHPLVPVPSFKDTRGLEWTAKGGGGGAPVAASDQQWQQLMRTKIGLTLESSASICNSGSPVYNQQYQEEPINLNSYTDFSGGADHHPGRGSSNNNMFLNPEIVSLQKTQNETPRAFIDAWSIAVTENPPSTCNKTPISSDGKLPLSSLTLTMGGGNGIEVEMGSRIEEAAGCSRRCGGEKPELSTWLTPAPWAAGSAPGGPLAEVLRPSSAAASSNPGSPQGGGNGGSISPSETAASSPSGVLQKPVVSPTSSGNSSPTHLSGPQARAENTFPWLSQSKAAAAASGSQ